MRSVLVALAFAFVATFMSAPARADMIGQHPALTPAFATTMSALQNPVKDVNVDINVNHGGRVWYHNPVWIAIGVLAGIVLLVLILLAVRGAGTGGSTTILRG